MLKAVAADLTIKPDTVETLLYGNNPKRGVVGMDVDSDGSVALFLRDPDGVRRLVARHRHFFLLSDDSYLADYDGVTDIDCLSGEGHFRYACYYQSRSAMWKYLNRAIRNYGREQGAVYTKADLWRIPDILSISDSEEQFLISSCIGQFRGMEFSDLRRMQIALHADMPYEPEYTSLTDKRIALRQIALTDSAGWSHVIDSRDMPEKEMLRQFLILIKERDPDVIEGHDLFRTILPIIDMKCVQNGILFRAGRRMSFVENYSTTRMKDDRSIPFTNYVVPGRHIVDTMFLAEKSAPEYLIDIDAKDVAAVDAAVCGKAVRAENGDALARATATARISDALLPAEFFQAQMVPIPLGKLCMAGSAKKIDYLMIRAYLSAGHTIPKPPKPETFEGGLCEQFIAGRCENVVKIDVESQYPSLMIGEDIKPESDSLDVFLPMLKKLTWLRLEAKMKRDSASGPQRDRHDHLQKALKLLINSFYGYLGYRNAHFADFAAAARVTSLGRAVMKKMIETLDGAGYSLIQCDTDGAFFTPPFDPETDRERLTSVVEAVEKSLPQYLDIAVEGVWPAMLSLKKKNYALLAKDGSVSITGGILKSSADERFVRKALAATAECILKNDLAQLHAHLCALRKDVSDGRLSLPDIYFTETIRMNNQEYLEYIAGGGGRKPVHEGILKYRKNKGDRAFPVGNDVRHYHRDNQGQTSVLPSFSFEFDPEHPDYDRSHYLNRLSGALRRLNPLFTPEQFSLIFSRPPVEAVRRAAKKISVGATIVGKTASSGLDRYVELSSGYKKGKGIKRNVFVKADDEDAIREFREKNSDTDVYRSTYEYLCDRPPLHGLTRFCPKRGDFVIEIESETGEHVQNVSSAIAAARHCAEVIERTLSIPLSAITYCYNGGKSFYLTVPQKAFGLPDCIELNGIYECVARHIRDNMDEEHRGAMDMDLYNHDRPLRIQGTVHPKHGLYNTRLTTDEFFNLTAQDIIRLARFLREAPAPELLLDDFAGTQEIVRGLTKDFPRTETFNPNRKPFRVNMQAKNWRSKTAAYLKAHNISIRIPCVEALTALIHSGGSIGFDGRVKLITELRDTGSAEEEIISIFHDSPFFHQKYMNEIILPDSRSESMRGESGFMIRPDIWERYDGISCANCQKWCDPNQCYRNLKLSFFNEAVSPPYAGFRSMSQDALKTALSASLDPDNIIRNFFKINLIEAPMASGKTYQAVNAALVLAEQGRRSLILAPNHTTCAEAVDMAQGMFETGLRSRVVHLVGRNETSCVDINTMVGACASCRCGVDAFTKNHPETISEIKERAPAIYSIGRMKEIVGETNKKHPKSVLCLRTLSMLMAPHADVIVAPFIFFIDRNLRGLFGEMPDRIFIDEGDLFSEQLMEYCHRFITVALPRTANSGCMRNCGKPRCGDCRLSYSTLFIDGDMEPRARSSEASHYGDPEDFINALMDAVDTVERDIGRGYIKRDVFSLEAVRENIGRLQAVLKPGKHYLKSGEKSITVREHLERENVALTKLPGETHSIVVTGRIFGAEKEITRYPFVNLLKPLVKPNAVQCDEDQFDDGGHDRKPGFTYTPSSVYVDRESFSHYRQGDGVYRNNINIFLSFLEFCENAPGGALLRHVPRNGVTDAACRIVLSYMDDEHFKTIVESLQLRQAVLLSGTFMSPRQAAAVLLLEEDEINYHKCDVKMHNLACLTMHNSTLGNVLASGNSWDNPEKPKSLDHAAIFSFFNYAIALTGEMQNLYLFAKNKNMARAFYDTYRRNSDQMLFKAQIVDSRNNIIAPLDDDRLFRSNAAGDEIIHLERASRMIIDNYRSARSRGKNLPDFRLSVADGNGRANFDRFFDYVVAIKKATKAGMTVGDLLSYNRNRAVCQAMLRTPRDDRHKHLIVYNGDMTPQDVPEYLRNRIVNAGDLYTDFVKGTRQKRFRELKSQFMPASNQESQMLMLAEYFREMSTGDSQTCAALPPDVAGGAITEINHYPGLQEVAGACPAYSEAAFDGIVRALSEKGHVAYEDVCGRKKDWLALVGYLVETGALKKTKQGRNTIFTPEGPNDGEPVPGTGGNRID